MTNQEQPTTSDKQPTIWGCIAGAAMSGAFAMGMYFLTSSIAQAFASKPLHTANITAQNISVAVRTLVVGITTLGTGIFAITTLGLLGLAIQLLIHRFKAPSSTTLN